MRKVIGLAVLTALVLGFSGCESKEEKEIRLIKEAMVKEEKDRQKTVKQKEQWIKTYQSDFKKAEKKTKECEKEKLDPFMLKDECKIAMQAYYKRYFQLHSDEIRVASKECKKDYSHFKCSEVRLAEDEIQKQEEEELKKKFKTYYDEHFNEAIELANKGCFNWNSPIASDYEGSLSLCYIAIRVAKEIANKKWDIDFKKFKEYYATNLEEAVIQYTSIDRCLRGFGESAECQASKETIKENIKKRAEYYSIHTDEAIAKKKECRQTTTNEMNNEIECPAVNEVLNK
jgi:hypothetical protein